MALGAKGNAPAGVARRVSSGEEVAREGEQAAFGVEEIASAGLGCQSASSSARNPASGSDSGGSEVVVGSGGVGAGVVGTAVGGTVSSARTSSAVVDTAGAAVPTVVDPGPLEHAPTTSAIAAHHPMPIRLFTLLPAMRRLAVERCAAATIANGGITYGLG